jgi:hypothetical protein
MRIVLRALILSVFVCASAVADAQARQAAPAERTVTGVVVSASDAVLILRGEEGRYSVVALDRDTARPGPIRPGSRVRVVGRDSDEFDGIPVAVSVTIVAAPPDGEQVQVGDPVPPAVRRLERQIERQARRYRIGGFAAMALDPELVTIGARGAIGPIFDTNFAFRPNIELGFGEITTLLGVNIDGVYYLGRREVGRTWLPYVGGGVNLSFRHESLDREVDGRSFDFGNFDLDSGVNFLAGFEHRSNLFVEFVAAAYASPHVRLIIGVNFW